MSIKKGDKIKVDYEGRFESGEVFDSSRHGEHSHPIEFTAGSSQVIAGFDEAVIGMNVDEEKEFKINAKEAYGECRPDMIKEIPRSSLPQDQEPKQGMVLVIGTPDGHQIPARISEVSKESIKIDLNHPLAGKNLIFKIKIAEIEGQKDAKTEKLEKSAKKKEKQN